MPKKSGFVPIIVLIVVVFVVGGIWLGLMRVRQNQSVNPVYSPSPIQSDGDTSAWVTYSNKLGFSVKYPKPDPNDPTEKYNSYTDSLFELNGLDFLVMRIEIVNTNETDPIVWWKSQKAEGYTKKSVNCFSEQTTSTIKSLYDPSKTVIDFKRNVLVLDNLTGNENRESSCAEPVQARVVLIPINRKIVKLTYTWSAASEEILSTFKLEPEKTVALPTPPAGWKAHNFSSQKLTIYTPTDWDSNIQSFPESSSTLIKFWKKASPDIVPIQLDIKADWSNTGDAQYLTKNYTVGGVIPALRVDPPAKQVKLLERYEMVTYFEYLGKVHVFECVHNWTQDYVDTCNKMLETIKFTQ